MKDLTKGNIYKTFFLFSIPLVLSGVLSQMFSTVNAIMAGWFFDNGLASLGATEPFIQFVSSIFWGYSTGFGVLLAKMFGAKDYAGIKKAVTTNFLLMGAAVIATSILIILCQPIIFDFLQVDPALRQDAAAYFIVYMIGLPLFIFHHAFVCVMHAFGVSGFTSVMSILSMSINLVGNLIIVGCFNIGPMGLAISSIAGNLTVVIIYLFKLRRCYKEMGVQNLKTRFDRMLLPDILRYSLPTSFQQLSMYFASMILSPFTNMLGADASAAYSVQTKLTSLCTALIFNASKALSAYTAQSIGAGELGNLKKGVRAGALQGLIVTLPGMLACVLFPNGVSTLFLGTGDTGMAATYAAQFAQYCMPFIIFNMLGNLFHSYFRGCGVMRALIATTMFGSIVRIVLTALLVGTYGMYGVFIGWVGSWVADGGLGVFLYLTTNWPALLADKVPHAPKPTEPAEKSTVS